MICSCGLLLTSSILCVNLFLDKINMTADEFLRIEKATNLAIERILSKGSDDVFKPPTFSSSIEVRVLAEKSDDFRKEAKKQTISFLKTADLTRNKIGPTRRGLVVKDQNSFRQCAWLDPFDAVKYLAATTLLFEKIEAARIPKEDLVVHSHRMSDIDGEIFDPKFGYDSFRVQSSAISQNRIGHWKIVTDISNFFDRIGNHSLENHLKNIGCDKRYVDLIREMLLFWAGDRRSFGVPVGSDASRILSEAVLLNVDAKLMDAGFEFVRYVDDFRIFADTRAKAFKAVEVLTTLLADEGLALNSKKTEIHEIIDAEELTNFTNKFAGGEHDVINLEEKIEVVKRVHVSGRSSISRFYREPGKLALIKLKLIDKDKLLQDFVSVNESDVEQKIKLLVKYFVYVDQDTNILRILLGRRITSIYYIADALVKEAERFEPLKRDEIKTTIFDTVNWFDCAYPLQIPVLRVAGHSLFREDKYVKSIVNSHLQTDSMLFFREAVSLGSPALDRAYIRKLAIDVFENVPDFVRRAIYFAVKNHDSLTDDEKRPLLKNMQQHSNDWFISRI